MITKRSAGEWVFDTFNVLFMIFLVFITAYPIYYVAVCSFSDSNMLLGARGLILWPMGFNTEAYKAVFGNPNILTGYRTTLIVLVVATTFNIIMTSICAFLITRKKFAVKKITALMATFTMFFSGGMIPTYLVIYQWLHLGDSLWALIIPGAISTYNMLIMKNNFESIPDSLEEAAKIDGANEITILFKIIIPLSLPIIAVMVLYYGVGHWNAWFNAMMYIRSRDKYPLTLILREILLMNDTSGMDVSGAGEGDRFLIGESIKHATIMVATVPILCVYPFIQKYFVKGTMAGAVKG
ncbi:MAG: carbohydrate ABC transporter permease [Clostridia bacterium]|nr:carbohydrate ABC transporter permease [Clostridia bacterium]